MKVALYARVSSEKQDTDLSISAQLRALREYAIKNGYLIIKEYIDEAESGRTAARPAFREMISMAKLKHPPFDMILVWKLSRFARNREDSIIYKSLLRKQGIQIVSINEPIEDTPTGRLMEGIIEVIDEFYSSNLAQDVIRGMRENAARGFFNGSRAPFGYIRKKVKDGDAARNTLEPDPARVPIIQRIFRECADGKGLKEITKGLNRDGIPSPAGGKWGKQRIHKILTNEAYVGCLVWGKNHQGKSNLPPVRKEGAWPAIVDKETFERVQATLNARAPKVTHPRITSSHYLLSGLIRCRKCGAAYIGYGAKSGRFHYYVCGTAYSKGKETCDSQHLPKDSLEKFVIERIKGYILTDGHLAELVRMINEELDGSIKEYEERIEIMDGEIEQWQSRLERLYDFVETRAIEPARMANRITEVQDKIDEMKRLRFEVEEALRTRRLEPIDPETVLEYVKDLKEFLEESSIFEGRAFLRSFIESIEVDDGQITVNYTLPLPPDNSRQESISVLGIVPSSPPKISVGRIPISSDALPSDGIGNV
jgi:DNA invertase Pin-like site-specific DNA recombinase